MVGWLPMCGVFRPFRPPETVWRGTPPPTYLATLTFEALGNETIFTMRAEFESAAALDFATKGGFYAGTKGPRQARAAARKALIEEERSC